MKATRPVSNLVLAALAAGTAACSTSAGPLPGALIARGDSAPSVRPAVKGIKIKEFADLPQYDGGYFPAALTVGPDKALWIADDIDQDLGASAIARVTTAGKRTNTYYYHNSASPAFKGIAAGSDGALWLTDWGDAQIVRVTTQGSFSTFTLDGAEPQEIVAGPDRALWFTENGFELTAIGRMTTSGHLTLYTKGLSQNAAVNGITVGPDGALWFTEPNLDRVGRITMGGKVTEYSKGISSGSQPNSISSGPDGALWFTEMAGGRIGRITLAGMVTEYSRGIKPAEQPAGIAAGPDGALWFTEYETYKTSGIRDSKVGRITTSGKITEYSRGLRPGSQPTAITAAPDGNMWFVESNADQLGRIKL